MGWLAETTRLAPDAVSETVIADAGLSPDWQLIPNMKFTMDMFEPNSTKVNWPCRVWVWAKDADTLHKHNNTTCNLDKNKDDLLEVGIDQVLDYVNGSRPLDYASLASRL
jgi:hypothetical protein